MAYIDETTFENYVRNSLSGVEPTVLNYARLGAEASVRDFCQRDFTVATGTASARTYSPVSSSADVLRIHDCVSITSVVENSVTLTDGTDFQAEPLNNRSWSNEWRPFEEIRRFGTWYYDQGKGTIVVTADWGWQAVPDAVIEATLIIGKDIAVQRNVNSGMVAGDFGAFRVRQNPIALGLLTGYARIESFGIA